MGYCFTGLGTQLQQQKTVFMLNNIKEFPHGLVLTSNNEVLPRFYVLQWTFVLKKYVHLDHDF